MKKEEKALVQIEKYAKELRSLNHEVLSNSDSNHMIDELMDNVNNRLDEMIIDLKKKVCKCQDLDRISWKTFSISEDGEYCFENNTQAFTVTKDIYPYETHNRPVDRKEQVRISRNSYDKKYTCITTDVAHLITGDIVLFTDKERGSAVISGVYATEDIFFLETKDNDCGIPYMKPIKLKNMVSDELVLNVVFESEDVDKFYTRGAYENDED